ncbi:hypothetical protein ACP4OV_012290 [Aristida adscensionis]
MSCAATAALPAASMASPSPPPPPPPARPSPAAMRRSADPAAKSSSRAARISRRRGPLAGARVRACPCARLRRAALGGARKPAGVRAHARRSTSGTATTTTPRRLSRDGATTTTTTPRQLSRDGATTTTATASPGGAWPRGVRGHASKADSAGRWRRGGNVAGAGDDNGCPGSKLRNEVFHQNVLSFGASRFAYAHAWCAYYLQMQCFFLELELELAGMDFHIPRSSKE